MTIQVHGQFRLDADRAWRTPKVREQFEADTGLTDEKTEVYQTRFVEWFATLRPLTACQFGGGEQDADA